VKMNHALQRFKAELFKAVAHPSRIRILELLRQGEMTVGDLQEQLGSDGSSVSQQLAVLRGQNIVESRRWGTSVYYTVRDPAVFELLDVASAIFDSHLATVQAMALAERGAATGAEVPA
jgi:DNA-binding transcriptional ArsR family regulator